MQLVIFGAAGKTGQHLVEQALAAGHAVTAYVRTPAKLAIQHERLTLVQGDIRDTACVAQAITGADAVLSVLGPTSSKPEFIVSQGMAHIIAAMRQHGGRRLIISAGAGVGDPDDQPKLLNHVISLLLRLLSANVVEDMVRTVTQVRQSDLDWTVVRVPMLTDKPRSGQIRVGMVGRGTGAQLARADLAAFMLQQVSDNTHIHRAPVISN